MEFCACSDAEQSQKLFRVCDARFFSRMPDATRLKSTRRIRSDWTVKLSFVAIRGGAHQRNTAALRWPGDFPARQRPGTVSPGETLSFCLSSQYSCAGLTFWEYRCLLRLLQRVRAGFLRFSGEIFTRDFCARSSAG